ncbi:MAG: hypothetical protein R3D05_04140 [Dongiaceae bacterium]
MAHISFRLSATWSETLLHRLDVVLEQIEQATRELFADKHGDFRDAAHAAQLHRLAAHGCNGQALI